MDTNDVGNLACQFQRQSTTATQHYRWPRLLNRLGQPVEIPDRVVRAAEVQRLLAEQPVDHGHRLLEPRKPHRSGIEGKAGRCVVGFHPAGAEPDLDTSAAEHVQRRERLVERHRMSEVVAETSVRSRIRLVA